MAKRNEKNKELTPPAGGSATIGVTDAGLVFIQFPTGVNVTVFRPEQAEQFGIGLIQHAAVGTARQAQTHSHSTTTHPEPRRKM